MTSRTNPHSTHEVRTSSVGTHESICPYGAEPHVRHSTEAVGFDNVNTISINPSELARWKLLASSIADGLESLTSKDIVLASRSAILSEHEIDVYVAPVTSTSSTTTIGGIQRGFTPEPAIGLPTRPTRSPSPTPRSTEPASPPSGSSGSWWKLPRSVEFKAAIHATFGFKINVGRDGVEDFRDRSATRWEWCLVKRDILHLKNGSIWPPSEQLVQEAWKMHWERKFRQASIDPPPRIDLDGNRH